MIKLALTGNIASGKSLIEKILIGEGVPVIDADEIVHQLLSSDSSVIEQVRALFSPENVLLMDGSVDRKKVGQMVFSDIDKLRRLEEIIHPRVKEKIDKFFESNSDKNIAVASIALLFETGWNVDFDKVVLVTCFLDVQIERLMNRDNLSREDALKRINSQMSQHDKAKISDFVIENNSGVCELEKRVREFLKSLVSV